jgi:hypothetical protein
VRELAGRRFVESEQYRSARERGAFKGGNHPMSGDLAGVEVADTREIVRALKLRTYADLTSFDIEGVPYVGESPKAAHVPQAVETIPTEHVQIEVGTETVEGQYAAGVNDGQPYVEAAMAFAGTEGGSGSSPTLQKLTRFGISVPVTLGVLDDPGKVESLINRRMGYSIGLGLENEMINGGQLMGTVGTSLIAQAAAPGSPVAKGSSYRAFAIRNAVADVQEAGWYERPLQVVINPITAASLFEEEDNSNRPLAILEMFDSMVDAWIVSKVFPAGQALVGDFFNAVALHVKGPLTVGISRDHQDFRTRDMVMMTLGFRAFADVREASALCQVTGIT